MTPSEKLAALKEMCGKTHKGPWGFEDPDNSHLVTAGKDEGGAFIYIAGDWGDEITNKFIAACRTLLPAALKVIEEVGEMHKVWHRQAPFCDLCVECYGVWPCDSRRLIDAFWEAVQL